MAANSALSMTKSQVSHAEDLSGLVGSCRAIVCASLACLDAALFVGCAGDEALPTPTPSATRS